MVMEGLLSLYKGGEIKQPESLTLADIESAFTFVSSATSLVASLLIAYRIYALTRNEDKVRRRYMPIVEIVIQSVIIYSVALVVLGFSGILPLHATINQYTRDMTDYMTTITSIIAVRALFDIYHVASDF